MQILPKSTNFQIGPKINQKLQEDSRPSATYTSMPSSDLNIYHVSNSVFYQLTALHYKSDISDHFQDLVFIILIQFSIIRNMLSKLPITDYLPNQVVLIRDNKDQLRPAKIIIKSSYGTYKIKLYGARDQQYVSEYRIEPYSERNAQIVLAQIGKNNKKQIKFFKSAQKDNADFQAKKLPQIKLERFCKQEEEEGIEEEGLNNQQKSSRAFQTKYDAILNLKVSTLLEDHKASKETIVSFFLKDKERSSKQNPKDLLIKKLLWAFEDICFLKQNQLTEKIIFQILDSQVIEPVEYVTTPLHRKLALAIQFLQKNRQTRLKNYLQAKRANIISGVDNFLNNYSLFLRVKQNFNKFLTGATEKTRTESICDNKVEEFEQSK